MQNTYKSSENPLESYISNSDSTSQVQDQEEESSQSNADINENPQIIISKQMHNEARRQSKSPRKASSNQFQKRIPVVGSSWDYENLALQKHQTGIQNPINSMIFSNNNKAGLTTTLTGGVSAGGGLDGDIECEESDFLYLSEIIQKVKQGYEGQYQLSDFLDAALAQFQIPQNEDWDAILAEAKEMQKTLKKVIDINVFLLDRAQQLTNQSSDLVSFNSTLQRELSIAKDQNECLIDEIKVNHQRMYNQQEAIKTYEKNLQSLNEQLQSQLDVIRRLESDSVSNQSVSRSSILRQSALKIAETLDNQQLLNERKKKIDELENLLSEQTSKYYSEAHKNHNLLQKLRNFKDEGDNLNQQIEQLLAFLEEKDGKIMELEDIKRNYEETLLMKEVELKNQQQRRPIVKINNPIAVTQIHIDKENRENDILREQENSNYNSNLDTQKRILKISHQDKKLSEELDRAINKIRESTKGIIQRSFIQQQSILEIKHTHHKRMQTIDSSEIAKSLESPDFMKPQKMMYTSNNRGEVIQESAQEENIFTKSRNKGLQDNFLSPQFSPKMKVQQCQQNQYDPSRQTYAYFDEEDMVEMTSGRKSRPLHNQSNLIGVNESDLMEFEGNHQFPEASQDQSSEMDFSVRQSYMLRIAQKNQHFMQTSEKKKGMKETLSPQLQTGADTQHSKQEQSMNMNTFVSDLMKKSLDGDVVYETLDQKQSIDSLQKLRAAQQMETYTLSFNNPQLRSEGSLTKLQQKLQIDQARQEMEAQASKYHRNKLGDMEEYKLEFLQDNLNNIKIGNRMVLQNNNNQMLVRKDSFPEEKFRPSEVNCITVEADDTQINLQRSYEQSQIDTRARNTQFGFGNNNLNAKKKIEVFRADHDAQYMFFHFSCLAYFMRHQKRSYLFEINIEKLYKDAISKKVPFENYQKWIQEKMIDFIIERRRIKKAQMKNTFLGDQPPSYMQFMNPYIIDNHFNTQ